MKIEDLTSGNSAFIFHTPRNDVGIWYEQINGAKETASRLLEKIKEDPESVSQLEKDNALMKIREVVLDLGESGTKITTPKNISWFPNQWLMLILWIVSPILLVWGLIKWSRGNYY